MNNLRIILLLSLSCLSGAFVVPHGVAPSSHIAVLPTVKVSSSAATNCSPSSLRLSSQEVEDEEPSWRVDPFFGTLVIALIGFAAFGAPGELNSVKDLALLDNYIADPLAPQGFNSVFYLIFNLLGAIPIIATSVALPQGSRKGLPAAPFLGASAALGFFGAGPYLTFRAPARESVTTEDLSWFTRNVVENKIFNWGLVVFVAVIFATSGVFTDIAQVGVGQVAQDFAAFASDSKFVSISSMDAVVYNIAICALIAQDYKLRDVEADDAKANMVGASTLLLPFFGPALYCALRPKLPEA
jgi:hypothetical protein